MIYVKQVIDSMFPPKCISCQEMISDTNSLCHKCWSDIEFVGRVKCDRCSFPNPVVNEYNFVYDHKIGKVIQKCDICLANEPIYNTLSYPIIYNETISKIIKNLKYYEGRKVSKFLAKYLLSSLSEELLNSVQIITPVPLHKKRIVMRGFNQSDLICREMIKLLKKRNKAITYIPSLLIRIKNTFPQALLPSQERRVNLIGAFAVNHKYIPVVKDKGVLIVDDVYTTGSSTGLCAEQILRYHPLSVHIACVARSII